MSLSPHAALVDDTDELLELIAKSDDLLTPRQRGHTRPGVVLYGNTHPNQDACSPTSLSSSDSQSDKSSQFSDEFEAYTNLKVKGNFTAAPVARSNQQHLENPTPSHVPRALKELVDLMQG